MQQFGNISAKIKNKKNKKMEIINHVVTLRNKTKKNKKLRVKNAKYFNYLPLVFRKLHIHTYY